MKKTVWVLTYNPDEPHSYDTFVAVFRRKPSRWRLIQTMKRHRGRCLGDERDEFRVMADTALGVPDLRRTRDEYSLNEHDLL